MNAHVSAPLVDTDRRGVKLNRYGGRLTPEQVRDAFLSTESTKTCAARLGVSYAQISLIRNRKAWADITKDLVRPAPTSIEGQEPINRSGNF